LVARSGSVSLCGATMPELPDVESFRKYPQATSLHQRLEDLQVSDSCVLTEVRPDDLRESLVGSRFESTLRHGKNLFVRTDGPKWLRLHFGITLRGACRSPSAAVK